MVEYASNEIAELQYLDSTITNTTSGYWIKNINYNNCSVLTSEVPSVTEIEILPLPASEYFGIPGLNNRKTPANQILHHHTAGHDSTQKTYETFLNKPDPVATHFCIDQSGKIAQFLPLEYWAIHAGKCDDPRSIGKTDTFAIEVNAIGIEMCSWGALSVTYNANFIPQYVNWVGARMDPNKIYTLDKGFRGFLYFENYTEKQLSALFALTEALIKIFNIKCTGSKKALDENRYFDSGIERDKFWTLPEAWGGQPGIYHHAHYRLDKSDCYPHVSYIDGIERLHQLYA